MTSKSVEELAETLVELAGTLSADFDVDDFLRLLASRCVRLLDVDAATVLLVDHDVVASSGEARAGLLAIQHDGEGPCRESCRTGEPVAVPDLAAARDQWPDFVAEALADGFASSHTIPLRWRGELVGALTVFHTACGELAKVDALCARAMADVAAIGILRTRALRRQEIRSAQLQHALNSRVVIEQAKGVLAERLGVNMPVAFGLLRTYARSHNARVSELAISIVDGRFNTDLLRP